MSTHPYIPLFVDDFDAATAHLTAEEDGAYNRLMRLCWRTPGCSLPNDPAWIARKVRLSIEDFERVAAPILREFFTLQRGRFIQRRLKREYDDISRKKLARKRAGKAGGDAKAKKTHENDPSNATVLPPDTPAFPDPDSDPHPREVLDKTSLSDASAPKAKTSIPEGLPDAEAVAEAELAIAAAGADLSAADQARRFRRHAAMNDRRLADWPEGWRGWVETEIAKAPKLPPSKGDSTMPQFAGPAELRAKIVAEKGDGWTAAWFDQCGWQDVPTKAILAPLAFTADTITKAVDAILSEAGVGVLVVPKSRTAA